ncbi:hypothetical protein NG702_19540 [Pseudarthrobacter sp. MDT3-28]|uniref:hypothetical protein n=1 Tax=Pseudarthrobacter raffinosi TaxID=2953651 RepID=UPI00208E0A1C|nr:hypothetical protein [Pseudarthrobacter sp. MDT3-28]MCO4239571.1 hypothetical protein [Pseudarthrobacter sp. MDT3-28]
MQASNYTVAEAVTALTEDQAISVASLTVDGKKAVGETVAELTQMVEAYSERQADTANLFLSQLQPEMNLLNDQVAEFNRLTTAMQNTPGPQDQLQAEFFALEAECQRLARRVLEKHDRIEYMLNDLLDPVAALSRLQSDFPTLRRPFLARFGR